MPLKLAPGLAVRESKIDGKGCFATQSFRYRHKIAEYAGELITNREAARRVKKRRKHRVVEINPRQSIDGARGGNGTHYINHSCRPNCFMKIVRGRAIFIALRDIEPGEEITLDYVSTYHSDRKRCRCAAAGCRGTINLLK